MPVRQVKNLVNGCLTGDAHWPAFASAAVFGGVVAFVLSLSSNYFSERAALDASKQDLLLAPQKVLSIEPIQSIQPQASNQREQILNDYKERISSTFEIPLGIKERVGFWFDIYSRYGYHQRVIHHSRYPWIIFEVVDVSEILNATTPRARWLREMRANTYVDAEMREVRETVWKLSKRKNFDSLSPIEDKILTELRKLPGDPRKNARQALSELRIQTGQRDFFQQGIELGHRYLPRMEEIFAEYGLPTELTRLPLVESSFNRAATSKAGASGVWQFIDVTGRKYMIVSDTIDERRSPFKSTEGAARLLKENFQILYKEWPLAITAYNHGPGGVRRAVSKFGSKDIVKLANLHQTRSFDFASQNYYSEFLAALFAEKYSDEIWENLNPEDSMRVTWYKLPRRARPSEILNALGMLSEDLVFYNPDIKKAVQHNAWLPAGFRISIPTQMVAELEKELKELRFKRAS